MVLVALQMACNLASVLCVYRSIREDNVFFLVIGLVFCILGLFIQVVIQDIQHLTPKL